MGMPEGLGSLNTHADLIRQLDRLRVRAAAGTGKIRLSVRDIAKTTGIPRSTLAGYLSGATPVPPDLLAKIVQALGTTPEETSELVQAARHLAESRHPPAAGTRHAVGDQTGEGPVSAPADAPNVTKSDADGSSPPRQRLSGRAVLVAAIAAGALVVIAVTVAFIRDGGNETPTPVPVTRIDSWTTVTPNQHGVARLPYCPATNPCEFTAVPQVLVTGRKPHSGNSITAGLIANGETTTEFTLRALNQHGRPITDPIEIWYHAAVAGSGPSDETGTATTTTDADGLATIAYAAADRGIPTAVIASGVRPSNGPAIPGSVIVTQRTADTFRVLVLSHTGTPIVNRAVTVAYFASWTTGLDTSGHASRDATTTITTDAAGFATITFPRPLPTTPDGIQAVGAAPAAATVLPHSATEHGFQVRVLDQNGQGVPATTVMVSYHAVSGSR